MCNVVGVKDIGEGDGDGEEDSRKELSPEELLLLPSVIFIYTITITLESRKNYFSGNNLTKDWIFEHFSQRKT